MNMLVTATPHHDDVNHIRQKLMAFNAQYVDVNQVRDLAVFIDDDSGNKIAGLLATTWGNWMHIHFYGWKRRYAAAATEPGCYRQQSLKPPYAAVSARAWTPSASRRGSFMKSRATGCK